MEWLKKTASFLAKTLIVAAVFYYLINNTDFEKVWSYISQTKPQFLLLALGIFLIMKLLMALRLKAILARQGLQYSTKYMFKTFMSGMFLNLAVPGFVGGDGYVAYRLKQQKELPIAAAIKAQINSRANGFFYVCIALYFFIIISEFANLNIVIAIVFALQVLVYIAFAKLYFKESLAQFLSISLYSIIMQIFSTLLIISVLFSFGIGEKFIEYIAVYFAAETLSMLPITPLGIGIRELVFFKAAPQIGVLPEKAIAISMVIFAVFVATAILGLIFYFSNKESKNGSTKNTRS